MRFLIDRCAGKRLADSLRQQEHKVVILQRHEVDLLSGAVITVKGDKIRVSRPLP